MCNVVLLFFLLSGYLFKGINKNYDEKKEPVIIESYMQLKEQKFVSAGSGKFIGKDMIAVTGYLKDRIPSERKRKPDPYSMIGRVIQFNGSAIGVTVNDYNPEEYINRKVLVKGILHKGPLLDPEKYIQNAEVYRIEIKHIELTE